MIAYFDCFAGISGDMTLGALLDAGAGERVLQDVVQRLGLTGEIRVMTRHEQRGHVGGTRVIVECSERNSRTLPQLLEAVQVAQLPERVKYRSLETLRRLGEAESRIHGLPVAEVHLHELSGADTLVDVVGAFALLDDLQVERVHASPLPAPQGGWVSEGMPVPAPASLEVLAGTDAVLAPVTGREELVTPTGAAILATVAVFERPTLKLARVGYGIGGRERPGNALAVWLGIPVEGADAVSVIETNVDDMAPNLLAPLAEDLLQAGALDVTVTPVLMKKGRPGHVVTVLAQQPDTHRLAHLLLERSTTLGVRITRADRVLAERRVIEVQTELGPARVKVKELDGRLIDVAPEYEDCRALAARDGNDVARVMNIVADAAREQLRTGAGA